MQTVSVLEIMTLNLKQNDPQFETKCFAKQELNAKHRSYIFIFRCISYSLSKEF